MRNAALMLTLFIAAPALAQNDGPTPLPEWMAGCWEWKKDQVTTLECWTPAQGSMLFGSSVRMVDGITTSWDVMQISNSGWVLGEPLVYSVAPNGGKATSFQLAAVSANRVRFTNPKNEFPQQIEYWREGPVLVGQVSQIDGSRKAQWRFVRQDFSKAK